MALNENAQYAYRYLQEKYGLSAAQAAGVVGNLMQESSLNTGALNPGDGSDGSNSIGIAQWNGDRAKAFKAFAGDKAGNLDTQLDYVVHELQTKEKPAWEKLQNAKDVNSATAAFIGYERPQGWSADNPTAGHGWGNRLKYAGQLAGIPPEQLAQAQAQNSPAPQSEPTSAPATTPEQKPDERKGIFDKLFGGLVPDEVGGMKTKDIGKDFSDIGKMIAAFDRPVEAPRGGLLGGASSLKYDPTRSIAPIVPSGGLLGARSGGVMNAKEEFEKRKRMMRLGGGLGGLGDLGGYV